MTATTGKTDAKPTVVEALAAVMGDVQAIRKTGLNSAQGFNFRGIDAVMNAVGPALRTHNVLIVPAEAQATYNTVTVGQRGTPMRECTLRITFRVHGPAGDTIDIQTYGEALDSGDKATSKAHSVAFRTALLQALCIPTDEPDPDEAAHERAVPPPPEPEPPRATDTAWAEGWKARVDMCTSDSELRGLGAELQTQYRARCVADGDYQELGAYGANRKTELNGAPAGATTGGEN